MSKPSILFIPGSFSLPDFYDEVITAVAAKGYEIKALHNPSSGITADGSREGTPATMYDDAANIAKEASKLVNEGKDVILVAHSYGGIPTTESTKGLSKKERVLEGKEGGIVKLAYMTCLVPAVGGNAVSALVGVPEEHALKLKIDDNGWMYHDDIPASAAVVFSDLPAADGEAWIRRFPRHTAVSFGGELTHAGYKDIPAAWLLCERDLCVPAKNQRAAIDLIEEIGGRKVDITSIEAAHVPNAAQPELVVEWVLDVASKV